MNWSDDLIAKTVDWEPKTICLSTDALDLFLMWRNKLEKSKSELPGQLQGFLSKWVGYSLRLACVLYLMDCFSEGKEPGIILEREDMQKGIDAVMFYAGHLVNIAKSLTDKAGIPIEITEQQAKGLKKTLESLRSEVDNGRLAIGYVRERFNEMIKPEQQITSRMMGSLLRNCGLTLPATRFRANGRAGIHCLQWDEKTENFIKNVHNVHHVHKANNNKAFPLMDIKNVCPSSPSSGEPMMDMMDIGNQRPSRIEPYEQRVCGHDGHDGHVSKRNKKKDKSKTCFGIEKREKEAGYVPL